MHDHATVHVEIIRNEQPTRYQSTSLTTLVPIVTFQTKIQQVEYIILRGTVRDKAPPSPFRELTLAARLVRAFLTSAPKNRN